MGLSRDSDKIYCFNVISVSSCMPHKYSTYNDYSIKYAFDVKINYFHCQNYFHCHYLTTMTKIYLHKSI